MEEWKKLAIKRINETIEELKKYSFYKRKKVYYESIDNCPVCIYMKKTYGIKPFDRNMKCIDKEGNECLAYNSCGHYLSIKFSGSMVFIRIYKLKKLRKILERNGDVAE